MSSESPKDTGEHPATKAEVSKLLTWHDIRTIGTVVVAIIAGTVTAWQLLISEARAQADAGVLATARRAQDLEERVKRHEIESAEVHSQIKEDLKEVQADIRALYKAVMTREPQERLERPDAGRE